MKELFLKRFYESMKRNKNVLIKLCGHSGVFALIPFLMLAIYMVIHFLDSEQLRSVHQSLILTVLFVFFVLNKGIISFISEYDEIYLAPKVNKMSGYFLYCLIYNLCIQLIKVTLFFFFLMQVISIDLSGTLSLFVFIQLIGIVHILYLTLIVSLSSKRPFFFLIVEQIGMAVLVVLLLEDSILFGVAIMIAIIGGGIFYSKNVIFPIYSWQNLRQSGDRAKRLSTLFLSSFMNVESSQLTYKNMLPLIFFRKTGNPVVYLLSRSTVRGTENSRNFMRVILVAVVLIVYIKNVILLLPFIAILVYFNTYQFIQGADLRREIVPLYYPIKNELIQDARSHLKKRAIYLQVMIFLLFFFIQRVL